MNVVQFRPPPPKKRTIKVGDATITLQHVPDAALHERWRFVVEYPVYIMRGDTAPDEKTAERKARRILTDIDSKYKEA